MVGISAKIEYYPNIYISHIEVTNDMVDERHSQINVSSDINDISNRVSKGGNPFLLGISKFSDKATYVDDKLDFYINDPYSFNSNYVYVTLEVNNSKYAIIYFDTVNNQYPQMIVGGSLVTDNNNSPVVIIPLYENSDRIGILMGNWSNPDYPIRIQGITTVVDIGKYNLTSINFSGQDRSDPLLPSWGIKSNSGNLEMFDTYGIIENMRNLGVLVNSQINIYLNAGNRTEQIGGFYVSNANKDRKTLKTKIEYQDILPSWENIEIKSQNPSPIVYNSLWSTVEFIFSNLGLDYINYKSSAMVHLKKINVPNLYYEDGSLWGIMTKICEVSGCYIYCDKEGIPTMNYNEGN